ncbi:FAD/NAD(P)-binding domain-containing protein [Mycena latifolia]|nr:FAD/NAD(P)-binding domain-containing protein [Mycena latifolia]
MSESPSLPPPEQIKTICVVGAGAAGLAVLRAILDTPQYKDNLWKPVVFEARSQVGGIWLPDPLLEITSALPQTPLYDSLTTNLPHPVMCFPSFPFPPSTPVFPAAAHVQRYLESYTAHFNLQPFIRLDTPVTNVRWESSRWKVRLGSDEILDFDLVIVANGHHKIPRYPAVPGIEAWLAAKKASHSVWYRHPQHLGNKILVVGGGPSGTDIAAEMRHSCTTLIRSITGAAPEDSGNIKTRGRTTKFGENGRVHFEDGSVETGVDYCILATGYQVSLPFLSEPLVESGLPSPCPPLPRKLHNSTYHIFPLAQHIFPIQPSFPPTSLVFMGLPVRVAPLPVMEAQAAAILHAFAHPESFDIEAETRGVLARYAELGAPVDGNPAAIARLWSVFKLDEQFSYQDRLYEFAGADIRVPQWRKDMYEAKALLRRFWVELERRGDADEWVRGVGQNGPHEWVDLLQKLLRAAEEWESTKWRVFSVYER